MGFFISFIFGILFGVLILPVIEGLISVINQRMQVSIYKMEVSIAKCKAEIQKLAEEPLEEEEEGSNPIGFQTQAIGYELNQEEEYCDEDEDE